MVGQFTEVGRLEEEPVWGGESEFCSEIQIKHSDDVVKKAVGYTSLDSIELKAYVWHLQPSE